MANAVQLRQISKSFGSVKVLDSIDLDVPEGSFTSLLGPSGCGKTTLLNIIGGLDKPTEGEISFGNDLIYSAREAVNLPTEKRNVGYVFQSYALWPHMTVLQNVGFPLRIRGLDQGERDKRTREMLERLELAALADRYPYQLSGGQQQRVAIARSLVYQPRLLLLDEPLSNLDAQLRERARAWLKSVHDNFGLTIILVTHDQAEALSLSNHIVLLSKGRIEQQGPAIDIYERPRTAYAAEFVGSANVLKGKLDQGGTNVVAADGTAIATSGKAGQPGSAAGVAIRPQAIRFADQGDKHLPGTLVAFAPETVLYLGGTYEITGKTPLGDLRMLSPVAPPAGGEQTVFLPAEACLRVEP
ncbi:MAG TPA: ABC transporter ATP-binding protein [Devosiaceae bacterium]|jgi:iron(III) transport system ATP-binding protein